MKFFSKKHSQLRIVLDPQYRVKEHGRSITKSLTGETQLGLAAQFEKGVFETSDKKTIEFLRNHSSYGISFFSDEPGEIADPAPEAKEKEEEKKAIAEQVRSQCPDCGSKFQTENALNAHMRVHKK
jgi:hypothetical protein